MGSCISRTPDCNSKELLSNDALTLGALEAANNKIVQNKTPSVEAANNKIVQNKTPISSVEAANNKISQTETTLTIVRQPSEHFFGFFYIPTTRSGYSAVIDIQTGGPASRAGLRLGDIVKMKIASADTMEVHVVRPSHSVNDILGKINSA